MLTKRQVAREINSRKHEYKLQGVDLKENAMKKGKSKRHGPCLGIDKGKQ